MYFRFYEREREIYGCFCDWSCYRGACLSSFYDHQHEYLNATDTDSYFSLIHAPNTTKWTTIFKRCIFSPIWNIHKVSSLLFLLNANSACLSFYLKMSQNCINILCTIHLPFLREYTCILIKGYMRFKFISSIELSIIMH